MACCPWNQKGNSWHSSGTGWKAKSALSLAPKDEKLHPSLALLGSDLKPIEHNVVLSLLPSLALDQACLVAAAHAHFKCLRAGSSKQLFILEKLFVAAVTSQPCRH